MSSARSWTQRLVPSIIAAATCLSSLMPTHARAEPPVENIAASAADETGPRVATGLVPIALPTYSPETRWAVGAALVYYRRSEVEHVPSTSVKLGVVGTQLHQFSLSTVADQYLADRTMRLSFTGSARRFPDYFWPIGPDSSEMSRESYRRNELTADTSLLWCRRPGLCAGPSFRVEHFGITDTEANGLLRSDSIPGAAGTGAWTAGLQVEWDSRDSLYFPHQGGLTIAKAGIGQSVTLGHGVTLGRLDLDSRRFFRIYREHVLAVQGVAQLRIGPTPFELMPVLGGDALLRGYYQGRYRDQHLLALQLEYRFPLWWRLGGVLFGGTGAVNSSLRGLASGEPRSAGGGGLRVTLDRDEHINLRVDIAANQRGETSGYLSLGEVF